MPSTRKQKAEMKKSRQSDVMSDSENMDKMFRNYSRNDLFFQSGERETQGDLESNKLQTANPTSEDFRSLIKTSSQENSKFTMETASRDCEEDLKTQILEVINSAIAEKVLPCIQNILGVQKSGLNTMRTISPAD